MFASGPKRTWHRSWPKVQLQYTKLNSALVRNAWQRCSEMEFIERYLGFLSGDGPFQALVLIALVAMIAVLARWCFHQLRG